MSGIADYARPAATLAVLRERYPHFDVSPYDRGLAMVRDARYKLIRATDGAEELYDLTTDPHEEQNLIAVQPDVAARYRSTLSAWQTACTPVVAAEQDHNFDARTLAMLEELGYL